MSVDTTSRVNLLQLWKKLQQSCPSMQSACIMLGAVAVTTLELTKQIQQLPAQQRVQAICSVGLKRSPEWERLWQCWHRTCLEWAMLRTIPWGSCSSKLWHSEPHSETCFIFPEQCRSAACAYGSALERIWHRWKWCDWSQMRFSLWFFHSRLQASAANRTILVPVTTLRGTYANVQTLPPFRLNWVCLLTLWTVGFLEWSFPSAICQEVYAFDAACRRSLHDWCCQL